MFWENFVRLCNGINKSPSAVTLELGFSNATATGWKKGANPNPASLMKIADYFHVSVEYLTSGHKEMPTQEGEHSPDNPDIRMIARAGKKMTPEQAENLRKYAQYMFPEAFADDE